MGNEKEFSKTTFLERTVGYGNLVIQALQKARLHENQKNKSHSIEGYLVDKAEKRKGDNLFKKEPYSKQVFINSWGGAVAGVAGVVAIAATGGAVTLPVVAASIGIGAVSGGGWGAGLEFGHRLYNKIKVGAETALEKFTLKSEFKKMDRQEQKLEKEQGKNMLRHHEVNQKLDRDQEMKKKVGENKIQLSEKKMLLLEKRIASLEAEQKFYMEKHLQGAEHLLEVRGKKQAIMENLLDRTKSLARAALANPELQKGHGQGKEVDMELSAYRKTHSNTTEKANPHPKIETGYGMDY